MSRGEQTTPLASGYPHGREQQHRACPSEGRAWRVTPPPSRDHIPSYVVRTRFIFGANMEGWAAGR